MTVAHAKAMLAGATIHVQPADPEEDEKRLRRLARWALRFSPHVASDASGLMLDLSGCAALFGGEARHVGLIDAAMAELGLPARLAVAPTPGCAWALARYGAARICSVTKEEMWTALSDLPVTGLRIDARQIAMLREVGVRRIGELLALPRSELGARFGALLLRRVDQALGDQVEQLDHLYPVAPLEAAHVFDGPVTGVAGIAHVVNELLHTLLGKLKDVGKGLRRLDAQFCRAGRPPAELTLPLAYCTCDATHLWSLLAPRLERLHMGFGIEEIRLFAAQTDELPAVQFDLWRTRATRARTDLAALGVLWDRLADRLGPQAVFRFEAAETYVPEQAFRPVAAMPAQRREVAPIHPAARPTRLFESPEPAQAVALIPDSPPGLLRWRGQALRILGGTGPERIERPWWGASRRGGRRDYYRVQDETGRWLWVFYAHATGGWFVHGVWG